MDMQSRHEHRLIQKWRIRTFADRLLQGETSSAQPRLHRVKPSTECAHQLGGAVGLAGPRGPNKAAAEAPSGGRGGQRNLLCRRGRFCGVLSPELWHQLRQVRHRSDLSAGHHRHVSPRAGQRRARAPASRLAPPHHLVRILKRLAPLHQHGGEANLASKPDGQADT